MVNFKSCNRCKLLKPRSDFYPRVKGKNLIQAKCKPCSIIISSSYIKKNPQNLKVIKKREYNKNKRRYRDKYYQNEYNITISDYDLLLEKQNEVCAICKDRCKSGKMLAVDHCHKTGKIRGLLCTKCNTGLGNFNDNRQFLLLAADYIS